MLYCMGFGAVGAFLGYLLSNGFFGQIAGISIGMICGLIVGAIFAFLNAKVPTPSLPPEVRISPNANAVESHEESQIALTIESRLSKLDALKVKGLVSSEEYAKKREKILNSL